MQNSICMHKWLNERVKDRHLNRNSTSIGPLRLTLRSTLCSRSSIAYDVVENSINGRWSLGSIFSSSSSPVFGVVDN